MHTVRYAYEKLYTNNGIPDQSNKTSISFPLWYGTRIFNDFAILIQLKYEEIILVTLIRLSQCSKVTKILLFEWA